MCKFRTGAKMLSRCREGAEQVQAAGAGVEVQVHPQSCLCMCKGGAVQTRCRGGAMLVVQRLCRGVEEVVQRRWC